MKAFLAACLFVVGVARTHTSEARAENSHTPVLRAQPHSWLHTGWTARLGSSVGYSDVAKERWSTLGAQLGVGYRIGPIAIEGEYETNKLLYYTGLGNELRGGLKRIGAIGRFYFASVGATRGGKSHFLFFADLAAGTQRGTLEGLPFSRRDVGAGAGILLDHRVDRSDMGIRRIGWHLGWRVTGTPVASAAMAKVVCKGSPCPMSVTRDDSRVDMGLALGSSLSLSW